jgi:DNA-binding XRE family transcriptional regulator
MDILRFYRIWNPRDRPKRKTLLFGGLMNNLHRKGLAADRGQLWLMKRTGIYFATISRIERGWLRPSEVQKRKLARALCLATEKIFPEPRSKDTKR